MIELSNTSQQPIPDFLKQKILQTGRKRSLDFDSIFLQDPFLASEHSKISQRITLQRKFAFFQNFVFVITLGTMFMTKTKLMKTRWYMLTNSGGGFLKFLGYWFVLPTVVSSVLSFMTPTFWKLMEVYRQIDLKKVWNREKEYMEFIKQSETYSVPKSEAL